jgi:Tol biopolymer transport system component
MNRSAVEQNLNIEPTQSGTFTWEGETMTFSPTVPWPGGAVISVTLRTGARSSLGISLEQEQQWSFSVARTMLAYLWPANGSADLYMLDAVGGEVVQLTDQSGILEFSVGSEGLLVYFSAENEAGGSGIWRLDMLTRKSEQVFDCGADLCALPQPSPDGAWLAYENTTKGEIWVLPLPRNGLNAQEGEVVLLGKGTRPLWSSEGILAYFDDAGKAFRIVDPAGELLISFPNIMGEPGAWSPNGSFFTAPETDDEVDASRLWAFLPVNGLINNLSGDGLVEDSSPAYSPDGQWLAFARKYLDLERWTPGRQLWVMEADGENPNPLTNDEFYAHTSFAWSPDSQTIAFVRAHRTTPEVPPDVSIIQRDGSNLIRLVVGGYAPQWIP